MTQVNISGKIDEALRQYAEQNCLNISKFVHMIVKEKLEKEGITIE